MCSWEIPILIKKREKIYEDFRFLPRSRSETQQVAALNDGNKGRERKGRKDFVVINLKQLKAGRRKFWR